MCRIINNKTKQGVPDAGRGWIKCQKNFKLQLGTVPNCNLFFCQLNIQIKKRKFVSVTK